jgi:[acyl-carrier-protein] S-malonyltransferase
MKKATEKNVRRIFISLCSRILVISSIAKKRIFDQSSTTPFSSPVCPVYQNVNAKPETDPTIIKENLIAQLTSPVSWTQSVQNMITDGATHFIELGPGSVLQGLIKKINRDVVTEGRE